MLYKSVNEIPPGATHRDYWGNYCHEREDGQYLVWSDKVNLWLDALDANRGQVELAVPGDEK